MRRHRGQEAALDVRGLLQIALHDAFLVLDFSQARMLNAHSGGVGHHREQVEIVFGKDAGQSGRVHVDEPDDPLLSLQRHGHERPNPLLDDALPQAERVVKLDIADQNGIARLEHTVTHRRTNAKCIAARRLHLELAVAFRGHENSALGANSLDGEVQDNAKQVGQGAVLRQFIPGADQRTHLHGAG